MLGEMYSQKCEDFFRDELSGSNENGRLYKGTVRFNDSRTERVHLM